MAEKVCTLVIEVELGCEKCFKKIQKVLCKLQEKEGIKSISYDTQNGKVTVSGQFDPDKLSRKLRCKACMVIKDIKIPQPPEPPPTPTPTTTALSSTTTAVNLQFTQVCSICYPWPCSDSSHCPGTRPQQWHCEGVPVPGNHQHCDWGVVPARSCPGPSHCVGCGLCGGRGVSVCGWPMAPPTPLPMCCTGPPSCRGCKGCRVVYEEKFRYEEYSPSWCAIM